MFESVTHNPHSIMLTSAQSLRMSCGNCWFNLCSNHYCSMFHSIHSSHPINQRAASRSSRSLIHDATSLQHHQSDIMVCLLIHYRDHHHSVMLYLSKPTRFHISSDLQHHRFTRAQHKHIWSILAMCLFSVSISHPHIHISLMSLTVNRTTISSWNSIDWLVLLVVSAIANHIMNKDSLPYLMARWSIQICLTINQPYQLSDNTHSIHTIYPLIPFIPFHALHVVGSMTVNCDHCHQST